MPFSEEQLNAINKRNKNIIVSAGAGSGKTAVLTERISKILEEGHTLDELLVLTFTNKAAAEMKERVRKKIIENPKISKYKDEVDAANITTFDSYCQFVVKKYGYLLNIAEVNVADSVYLEIKKNEILDSILLNHFKNDKDRLHNFYEIYPNKNDDELKDIINNVYKKIDLIIDKDEFYNNYFINHFSDEFKKEIINKYASVLIKNLKMTSYYIDEIIKGLEEEKEYVLTNDIKQEAISQAYYNFVNDIDELINHEYKYLDIYNLLKVSYPKNVMMSQSARNNVELSEIRSSFKEAKDEFNKIINDVRKKLISLDEIELEFKENIELSKLILDIVKEYDDKVYEFKIQNNIYSFMDIQKLAIRLLKIDSVKEEIKNSLYEILIDEYQDTSNIQEYFINLISNNNVYVVGDIKQSIYRFRNAEPSLFNNKYNTYSTNIDDDKYKNIRIDLTKNFRSRKEVLSSINAVFNNLMSLEHGSADFKKSHQMVYGLTEYDKKRINDFNYNMDILEYDLAKSDNEEDTKDDESYLANMQEIEANIIAKDINDKIANNFMVFDSDKKELRKALYSDFCILIDRSTDFEIIKKILENKNIPVSIEADLKINADNITLILSSLVNLVVLTRKNQYNSDYYHYFTSVARSYLFMMDDDKIFDIVTSAQEMRKYKNVEPIDNEISNKIKLIASKTNDFSNAEIFTMLLDEFKVIEKLPLVGDTLSKMVIIDKIRNCIDLWSSFGESLDTISEYIKEMLSDDNNKYSVDTTGANAVRIMTIHKSKGLEFPICYFPMLSKKFNQPIKEKIGFNEKYGLFFEKRGDKAISIIREIAKDIETIENLSEKIRLLYVALTRVREKIVLIYAKPKKDTLFIDNINSFNSMISYVKEDIKDYIKDVDLKTYDIDDSYKKKRRLKLVNYNAKPIYNDSSYLGPVISQNRISKEVIEVLSDNEQENIDLGLKYHEYMEMLDFNNVDTSIIKEKDIKDNIDKVLNNKIMKDLSKAKTYHEHEFIFEDKNTKETFHGIIDLLAVYPDHVDIIDYKLFHINDKAYDRQLSIYKRYVKSIINLPINCYLLSLANNEIREVNC